MNRPESPWQRLAAAARRAPTGRDEAAPFGFATRVAALGLAGRVLPAPGAVLEKFALRGLFAAGALSVAAVAFGYGAFTTEPGMDALTTDAVTEVLSQS